MYLLTSNDVTFLLENSVSLKSRCKHSTDEVYTSWKVLVMRSNMNIYSTSFKQLLLLMSLMSDYYKSKEWTVCYYLMFSEL